MKTNTKLLALAASTIALLAANSAQAAPFNTGDALSGTSASTSVANPDWSEVRRSGTNCNTGAPVALNTQYTNGNFGGRHGNMYTPPSQPLVAENLSGTPYTSGGLFVPANGVILHPGPTGECAILRLTIPAGQSGVYHINAMYGGAYANNGVSAGDGVNAMVLHNGTQIGNIVNTQRGPGQIIQQRTLCAGDTVDFAVHMKGNLQFDSTRLAGAVELMPGVPAQGCQGGPIITVPTDTLQGPSPCCAPWSELDILPSLQPVFTNAGSPYTMNYSTPAGISAQMSAYLNYVHAMDPTITELTLTWQAVDVGTTPGMTGPAVGGSQTVKWTWTNTGVNVTGGGFWGSQQFQIGRWYRFMTTLSHNGTANSPFFGRECLVNSRAVNWGVAARMATPSTTNARGQVIQGRAVQFTEGRQVERIEMPRD